PPLRVVLARDERHRQDRHHAHPLARTPVDSHDPTHRVLRSGRCTPRVTPPSASQFRTGLERSGKRGILTLPDAISVRFVLFVRFVPATVIVRLSGRYELDR